MFLACGFDKDGNPHFSDFGMAKEIVEELVDKNIKMLCHICRFYFDLKKLKNNKVYVLKFYIEDNHLSIEYFTSLEEILPTLKMGLL